MPRKRASKSPVVASGKIEAVVSAKYDRRHTSTEVIPADVTRAKAGAWLDLISPLTEWAGLRGDALRHKRDQLRLQREDVLAEIVKRCHERLHVRGRSINPVPNKFLVPFLEQASLEDPDSSLVDLWANLLASAAENFNSYCIHFVSVIARLSPKQGDIFKNVINTESLRDLQSSMDDIVLFLNDRDVRDFIAELVAGPSGEKSEIESDDDLCNLMHTQMNMPGITIVHSSAENLGTEDYFDVNFDYMKYKDEDEVDYSILEAIGLVKRVETNFFEAGNWSISLVYYHLTTLGFHFAKACKMVS